MAGTINSLGIGSGVLTADVIEKLKKNDETLSITPITNKITLSEQKSSELELLDSLLTTFKSSVSSLDDDTMYQKRSVSGNNDSISVSAESGVAVLSFSISDVTLAKKHVLESGSFSSTSASVATGSGTMTVSIDGEDYSIDYTSSTTLEDLKTAINNKAGEKVQASILQVGENDYRLITTSKATGSDQAIGITDSGNKLNSALVSKQTLSSQAFSASTDLVASGVSGTQTATFSMNGIDYSIDYTNTTTLAEFAAAINTATGTTIASVDSTNRLLIQSTIADDVNFSLEDSETGGLDSKLLNYTLSGLEEVQQASDASFKYNGITMSRSSNEITDITNGLTIKLLNSDEDANIEITQDVDSIATEMTTMVTAYNTLMDQLDKMTLADTEAGTVGVFNGDSSITNIRREITKLMTSIDEKGFSLSQFGIDLNETGLMTFNSTTFKTKFNDDPAAAELFFSGSITYDDNGNETDRNDGIFTKLNTFVDNYTKYNGVMSILTDAQEEETKALTENKKRTQELLDARYESMTARFIEYDAIISKLNNQFSSLSQQIQMAING